jgi:hypothetical protein
MILDIVTVLFFALGLLLLLLRHLERKRDVLYGPYSKDERAKRSDVASPHVRPDSSESDFSTAHEELSRIVKEIERQTREEQIRK